MASVPETPAQRRGGKRGNNEGTIYQRTERRKRPDGTVVELERWCAAITLPNGTRRTLYGKARSEVAKKLTAALKQKEDGDLLPSGKLTVGAWLDYWLEEIVRPNRSPKTYESYEVLLRRHLKPAFGTKPMGRLQVEDIEAWLKQAARAGVGLRTRQAALTRLRTALELARKRRHVAHNVATDVEMPASLRRPIAPPSRDGLRRLLHVLEGDRRRALILVALGCGLRRGEVLGLTWEGIDLEGRTLTVTQQVQRVHHLGLLVQPGAKTAASERAVPLPSLVVEALRERWRYQVEERLAAGPVWQGPDYSHGPTGFVFTSLVGTVIDPRNLNRYFEQVRTAAGLEGHTFHGLRHDFASLLLVAGVPGRVVMELMGHSSYSLTANRYQHVPDELQRVAADQLDTLLGAVQTGD